MLTASQTDFSLPEYSDLSPLTQEKQSLDDCTEQLRAEVQNGVPVFLPDQNSLLNEVDCNDLMHH